MDDCIAAISSATGEAGIGIVRMTGEGCVDVLDSVFKRANDNADFINRKIAMTPTSFTVIFLTVIFRKSSKPWNSQEISKPLESKLNPKI